MLKRLLKNEKGLTLIELLAVVVILGIIAAIAVPAIGKIIDDSREKAVVSDALQIINAAKIAKAANPKQSEFKKNDLDPYLDSEIDNDVEVTFSSDVWKISGHTELSELIADADVDLDASDELSLVRFLEGEDADGDGD